MARRSVRKGTWWCLVLVLPLLAACPTDQDPVVSGPIGAVESMDELVERTGCDSPQDRTSLEEGQYSGHTEAMRRAIAAAAVCKLDRRGASLITFVDRRARDVYLGVALPLGGVYLVGPNWLINSDGITLEELQDQHGGRIADAFADGTVSRGD